jgi:hypothetical protein
MGGRCSSGSSGVLTVGKGGDILHAGDSVIPAVGGGILGTCNGGGLNHVAIFDLPALGLSRLQLPFFAHTRIVTGPLCCCLVIVRRPI